MVLRFGVAVDREGDADPPEQQFRLLASILQRVRRRFLQPAGELLIGGTQVAAGSIHFVERNCHIPPALLWSLQDSA
jgi:hypothetical protein